MGNDGKDVNEMNIKKSLFAAASMALVLMGFASSATAEGVLREVVNTKPMPKNAELHAVGWTRLAQGALGGTGFECDTTANVKATSEDGKTGQVTALSIPDQTKCKGIGALAGCTLKNHSITNLPYHTDVETTKVGVTGQIVIHMEYGGMCLFKEHTLIFGALSLFPLKTGNSMITGTSGNLAEKSTAASGTSTLHGNPIAGWEIAGEGELSDGTEIVAEGELELTTPSRCTYYLSAN